MTSTGIYKYDTSGRLIDIGRLFQPYTSGTIKTTGVNIQAQDIGTRFQPYESGEQITTGITIFFGAGGVNWTASIIDANRSWINIASSFYGTTLVAVVNGGFIYTSSNSGVNWIQRAIFKGWQGVVSSSDGTILLASTNSGFIYKSTDSGVNWISLQQLLPTTVTNKYQERVDSNAPIVFNGVSYSASSAGFAVSNSGYVYATYHNGYNGTAINSSGQVYGYGGIPYFRVSTDNGLNWTTKTWLFGFVKYTYWGRCCCNITGTLGFATTHLGILILSNGEPHSLTTDLYNVEASEIVCSSNGDNAYVFVQNTRTTPAIGLYYSISHPFVWTKSTCSVMTGSIYSTCILACNSSGQFVYGVYKAAGQNVTSIILSQNYGQVYNTVNIPVSTSASLYISGIACNGVGDVVYISYYNQQIYKSTNSGSTWSSINTVANYNGITCNDDGNIVCTIIYNGNILYSVDHGVTWNTISNVKLWTRININRNGTILMVGDEITNLVTYWMDHYFPNNMASSNDGNNIVAIVKNGVPSGYIWTSTNSGINWTQQTGSGKQNWFGVASSSDGNKLAAVVQNGFIYTSIDSGVNWIERTSSGSRNWYGITSSSDGNNLAAVVNSGFVYTSKTLTSASTLIDMGFRFQKSEGFTATGTYTKNYLNGNAIVRFTSGSGAITFTEVKTIQYLVVAGGGGGLSSWSAAGGGGGGVLYNSFTTVADTTYQVTVGGGGSVGGGNGSNSVFGSVTATGGIGGRGNGHGGASGNGYAGGPNASSTANNGYYSAGGGGGASFYGGYAVGTRGGNGGNGLAYTITGSNVFYGGGGGGSARIYSSSTPVMSQGGLGGGGYGSWYKQTYGTTTTTWGQNATSGTNNTGGGGGGGEISRSGGTSTFTGTNGSGGETSRAASVDVIRNGGSGGSGVVIISIPM